jgi:hypothetical protein
LAKFTQEFVRRDIEGVLLKDAADDDHRVGSHDVDHLVAAKLLEMIGANDHVLVTKPNIIYARLELNDIVNMRLIFNRPVHATTNATQRVFSTGVAAGQLLKRRDHAICIETAIRKVDVLINAKLQLSALLRSCRIDSSRSQAFKMVQTLIRIHDVNRLMATPESFFYEWKQNPILFVGAVEKSADMTRLVELGTGKRDGGRNLLHSAPGAFDYSAT